MQIRTVLSAVYALLVTFSLSALADNGEVAGYNYLWMEAESGAEYNPIVVKSSPITSQSIYLASWKWADYGSRSTDDGLITFNVTVPTAGTYYFWGRTTAPWASIRPYWISVDGTGSVSDNSQWTRWAADTRPQSEIGKWAWSNSGLALNLSAGNHIIRLIQAEGGPQVGLDKVLLTNHDNYVPSGLGGNEPAPTGSNNYQANVVSTHGQLQVNGGQLVNQFGDPVQLQGISAHGLQWFPLIDNHTIPSVAEFFGAEVIRLAMYIEDYSPTDSGDYWGGYMAEPDAMMARTRMAIEDAINAGIYVIVDWHIHNIPANFTQDAVDFFTEISADYGSYPNVIYEIANEPTQVSWSSGIKPYANTVISAIRQNDPDNVVIVGTPTWSQDVDQVAQDPLSFSNVMYAFHFYAATHDINHMKNKVQTALNAGLAIFVSEWGTSDVGTSTSNFNVAAQWIDFMNANQLSWVNWSLGNKDETSSILKPTASMAGGWTSNDLTQSGAWLLPHFDDPSGGITPTPTPTPTPSPTPSPSPTPTPTPTPTPSPSPSPTPTPSPSPSPTPTPTPTPSGSVTCSVVENSWNNGFVAYVTVTNSSNTTINQWQVTLQMGSGDDYMHGWNAALVEQSGNRLGAANLSYNGTLGPGQSTTFGFQGSFSGNHQTPNCL